MTKRIGLAFGGLMLPGVLVAGDGTAVAPSAWMILPFVTLLFAIAVVPFFGKRWWEKWYPAVAVGLGCIPVVYYLTVLGNAERLINTAEEYVSFIALIGSLFVVSGGIHIRLRGRSTPFRNVALLGIGAVVANLLGTTGASMILIRPYLRVNRYRIKPFHVVFFIFIVSNMGGALTPIGDPPLFLGYLKGIPFFWVAEHLWLQWAVGIVSVLAIFYLLDVRSFARLKEERKLSAESAEEEGEVSGAHNVVFLLAILVAVFITDPPFLREMIMIAAAAGSYLTTKKETHEKNEFNFLPVKEVAILFVGIFATMVPALDWLEMHAASLGLRSPGHFFWASGFLSSFLDNAPTYVNFLSAAFGLFVDKEMVQQVLQLVQKHGASLGTLLGAHGEEIRRTFEVLSRYHADLVAAGTVSYDNVATACLLANHGLYIQAVSLGAVFFGSCTYIGNGPNFMVKSIAEQAGVPTPSFGGYILRYTLPVLLPVFFVIWLVFF